MRSWQKCPATLAALLALLLCCAVLSGCAGQRLEVKPRGQAVFGVGTGSR